VQTVVGSALSLTIDALAFFYLFVVRHKVQVKHTLSAQLRSMKTDATELCTTAFEQVESQGYRHFVSRMFCKQRHWRQNHKITDTYLTLGSVYFTVNILVATDQLELLCHQSKIWSPGMMQFE